MPLNTYLQEVGALQQFEEAQISIIIAYKSKGHKQYAS